MQERLKARRLVNTKSAAMKRLGDDLFLPVPLYRATKTYTPVYIDPVLFTKLFGGKDALSFEEMSAVICDCFNSTIEQDHGTGEVIGTAYVDRQADPLDMSLAGNQGSGRAYYMGKYFNIKGEKTPLATSLKRRFSDGLLEMERCIWESVVANALQGSLTNGLSGVLAILDMDETCNVVWRDKPVKRGKIIRVDMDGSLDRISHLFYNRQLPDLNAAAKKFGILEGDKFIERIVHGAWSPGNISPNGHLIDFDTVSTVKGRHPQYSSSRWHYHNYFGYEYEGQLNVLRGIAKQLGQAAPEDILLQARLDHIAASFAKMMGFENPQKIYKRFKNKIDDLCALWIDLAQKTYHDLPALSAKHRRNVLPHVFDFSSFFRIYPFLKKYRQFDIHGALALMCGTSLPNRFKQNEGPPLSEEGVPYHRSVMTLIEKDIISSKNELGLLQIAAVQFLKKYDALFEDILHFTNSDLEQTAIRAYTFNEDRSYLFPAYTFSFHIAERARFHPKKTDAIIRAIVTASRREADRHIADVRLHPDGFSFIQFAAKGRYKIIYHPYIMGKYSKSMTIERDGQRHKLSFKPNKNSYYSDYKPVKTLAAQHTRENYGAFILSFLKKEKAVKRKNQH